MKRIRALIVAALVASLFGCEAREPGTAPGITEGSAPASADAPDRPPNILLIVADDLGYSDLGIYGGEIETPNLDALAQGGFRFTQFYASSMCSPSRAMLLTGVDHHRVGLGNLVERLADNQLGQPGYEGHLTRGVATLAEVLQAEGYRTYLSGKWHLGSGPDADPARRGFDRAFALLESGAGHFDNMLPLLGPGVAEYSEDGRPLESLPEGFYSSRFYVRKLIEYLETGDAEGQPFFAYLAFTAPHFPLQAPRTSIEKYRGRYDAGYDAVHAARLERMQQTGLIPAEVAAFPQLPSEKPWDALSAAEKRTAARVMEVYAAMIDDMDREVGVLLEYLNERDLAADTLIVFLSDNGAEGHYLPWGLDPLVPWAEACCDNRLENLGAADSYVMLGPSWARVAAAPFRMFKGFTSEGGVRVPAFFHFPGQIAGGQVSGALATVKDIMPTVLDFAGIDPPAGQFQGRTVERIQGRSLRAVLEGRMEAVHAADYAIGWEMFGKRGLRQQDWKILWETEDARWWDAAALGIRRSDWQLYDLASDPAELTDLSGAHPERLEAMIRLWTRYAEENGVIIPDRQRGY